ncbi:hypothetical protein Gpo141_00007102, partial [Globisporangium polare]
MSPPHPPVRCELVNVRCELVNVHQLPSVDLTRSIKSLIFTERGLRRFNRIMSRLNRPMILLYCASFPADFALFVVNQSIGQWLALVKVVCQLPLLLQGVVMLRVDILRCLLWTYEFWFLSVMSVVHCTMFVLYFGDARAAIVLLFWIGSQLNICVDANLQTGQLIGTSLVGIFQLLWILITVALQLTPETNRFVLFRYGGHSVSNNDVMLNTVSTAMIYLIRTVFRKHQHAKKQPKESPTVQCVAYRCRVKFQVQQPAVPIEPLTDSPTDVRFAAAVMTKQQLRLVKRELNFLEADVVSLRVIDFFGGVAANSAPRWKIGALYAIGACSLVLSVNPTLSKKYHFQNATSVTIYG